MKKLAHFVGRVFAVPILSACFLLLFPTIVLAEAPPTPLLIGEVAWAGSSKSTADEWLELWNLGDEPIDLTGYYFIGAGGTEGIIFDESAVIPPRSAFLVANYDAEKSAIAIDPQLITTSISLPNDKLKIELFNADGILIDVAGDGTKPPSGASSSTKVSMVRAVDGSWLDADTRERMDEGIADFGTPGICDGCAWSEADLENANATTTDAIESTSSTGTIEIIEQTTTTTEVIVTETATSTAATSTQETIVETVTIPPPPETVALETVSNTPETTGTATVSTQTAYYPLFRLHRIFPAPPSGEREWVEVKLPDGASLSDLDGYALYDASSRVALFPPADMTLISQIDQIVRIELTSARLNNGGDTVELRRPDGSVVERMAYPKTASGESWIKNDEGVAWLLDGATPIEATEKEIIFLPPPVMIEVPVETSQEVLIDETADGVITKEMTPLNEIKTNTAATKAQKTTPAATKATTVSKVVVYEVTHDMLTKIEPNVRVAISGTVASRAGILNKNYYVLLSPDGHGLLVRGSSKQPTPPMGAVVRVTGTLTLNDDGLSLGVGTKDRWEELSTPIASPGPRLVNLLEPSLVDGWSLVEVRGTVVETKTTSALLDLGDALVNVTMKSASGYRASRLNEGDTVSVRGLLDIRGEEPAIVIRTAGDIEIVSHATLAAPQETPKGLPIWMPFGAAGATVAVSEGYKRFKRLRDKTRVKSLIAKVHAAE
jgi:hypothetical protein